MTDCLHLKLLKVLCFLAFVSLLTMVSAPATSLAANEVDEFAEFENTSPPQESSPTSSAPPGESPEQRIERLKNEIRQSPKNTRQIGELGEELLKKGEVDKVIALLWKHIDKIGRDGTITLAKAHEQKKEGSEMLRALNMLTGKNPKDYEAQYYSGNAYLLQRKSKQAMEAYKLAIESNPKFEPAYEALINFYEKRESPNFYELRIIYQDMVKALGPRPVLLAKLCQVNTEDGVFEPALFSCREAIAKDKSNPDSFVYLGLAYKGMGEEQKYQTELKNAAAKFPKSEFAQYQYGKLLEDQKNFIEAMKYYKAATEAKEDSSRAWLGLATSSFELKKYEVAHPAYKKACQLDQKTALAFRRATTILRNNKNRAWIPKFENDSETCTFRN